VDAPTRMSGQREDGSGSEMTRNGAFHQAGPLGWFERVEKGEAGLGSQCAPPRS
jgi:hypothetical protein